MKLDYFNLIVTLLIGFIVWGEYKGSKANIENKYRTFWPRFWAPTIDNVVLWIPTSLIPYLIFRILNSDGLLMYFVQALIWIVSYSYSIYFHGAFGATIGKMTTRLKVVDAKTESSITFKQALLRDVIPVILSLVIFLSIPFQGENANGENINYPKNLAVIFGAWFFIEIVTMFTNSKRRALHDFIAGTVVVRSNIAESNL